MFKVVFAALLLAAMVSCQTTKIEPRSEADLQKIHEKMSTAFRDTNLVAIPDGLDEATVQECRADLLLHLIGDDVAMQNNVYAMFFEPGGFDAAPRKARHIFFQSIYTPRSTTPDEYRAFSERCYDEKWAE
jgi:hypothetical protein